jgi:hypothetical protein
MVWRIVTSRMKSTAKFTIFGYVFTYYAIALALPLTICLFVYSLWQDEYQIVTIDPWKVFLGTVVVFQVVAPICFAVYRHRVGHQVFWKAWLENLKWSPFFCKSTFHIFDPSFVLLLELPSDTHRDDDTSIIIARLTDY